MSKLNVTKCYEEIVDWFDSHRNKDLLEEKHYLELIVNHIPKGGDILDVGCGTGEPIAKYFIKNGYQIHGIDGAEKMIALCQKRFLDHTWQCMDMREIEFSAQFDLVIAWHSFFHLPHEDQKPVLEKFAELLKPDGLLVFTSGPEYSETWSDNGGQMLYHASLSIREYHDVLKEINMTVIEQKTNDEKCGGATVWVAKKHAPAKLT